MLYGALFQSVTIGLASPGILSSALYALERGPTLWPRLHRSSLRALLFSTLPFLPSSV
jgi:hypothetical protein